jgi:hypothetical protein
LKAIFMHKVIYIHVVFETAESVVTTKCVMVYTEEFLRLNSVPNQTGLAWCFHEFPCI